MKRILLSVLTIIAIIFSAKAQNDTVRKTFRPISHSYTFDEKSVIKDSTGTRLPYAVWQKMMRTGKYLIRPINFDDPNTEFLIFNRKVHGNTYVVKQQLPASASNRVIGDTVNVQGSPLVQTINNSPAFNPANMPKPRESEAFKDGDKLTTFNARAIDGKRIKLKDLAGKVIVMNFWFIGCPPCRMEIPELNKLALDYADDPDVVFVSFGLDKDYDIKDFLKTNPLAFHIIDDAGLYAKGYGVHLYPTNLVVGKAGIVKFQTCGYAANSIYWIRKTIEESKKALN